MKHAYLLIANQDFDMLTMLLEAIDDVRNDIYLHIDLKSKQMYKLASAYKTKFSSFHVYSQYDIYWGDISQAMTELFLFKVAREYGKYSYYHLLSGVDYPIKSQDYIHRFCSEHDGKIFIGYDTKTTSWTKRYRYKWYFTRHQRERNLLKRLFFMSLINCAYWTQRIIRYNRSIGYTEIKKGCNWLSLPNECVEYLNSQNNVVSSNFEKMICVDEIFIQTIVWNSPFRKDIYDPKDEYGSCMREIDWDRGKPYVWCLEDIDYLLGSKKLFARKFSSKNRDLIMKIRESFDNISRN